MWYLDRPSKEELDKYANNIKSLIKKHAEKYTKRLTHVMPLFQDNAGNWVDELLDKILKAEPNKMEDLNLHLMKKCFGVSFNQDNWISYINNKKGRKKHPYYNINEEIKKVFDYNNIFKRDLPNWVAKIKQRNTCTYCNRQYIATIEDEHSEKITRPTFDHWYPRDKYPWLALSFYNLIPCCTICNSAIKGDTLFSVNTHVHPYIIADRNCQFRFRRSWNIGQKKYEIKIDVIKDDHDRMKKTINDTCLPQLYAFHNDKEFLDLLHFADAYPKARLDELKDGFIKEGLTIADAYRAVFGAEMNNHGYLDRPLSQMKHDILQDLGLI